MADAATAPNADGARAAIDSVLTKNDNSLTLNAKKMENKAIKTEYVDKKTAAELTEKVTAEIRSQLMTPLIRKIEPLKEVVERIESIEGTNTEYAYIRLPDNRELMNKINEIIETVNKMIEK